MPRDVLGQTLSLLTAVTWAVAVVFFKRSGEGIPPVALNLFKNAVGLVLLGLTLVGLALWHPAEVWSLADLSREEICQLLLSGIIGMAIADSLFFRALNLIGVGLFSIVDCAYAPLVVLMAWLLWHEVLLPIQYLGAALVVAGVFLATPHRRPHDRTWGQIVFGILLALLAIALTAFAIVWVKPILERASVVWSTTLRMAAGFVVLALFSLLGRDGRRLWQVFRPSPSWRFAIPGAVLGTYLCLMFWIGGYKYTSASIAGILNQTTVIFQALLAALVLREPFGKRQVAALAIALGGVAVVTFGAQLTTFGVHVFGR
mgnify:CR=1 FL=1